MHTVELLVSTLAVVAVLSCSPPPSNQASPGRDAAVGPDDAAVSRLDGPGDGTAARRICDGSDGIRFASFVAVDPSREYVFTATLYELGAQFLYVDGHCDYWIAESDDAADPLRAWRPYRQGTLTAPQETALHDLVGYDDFPRDGPPCLTSLASDISPVVVYDGASTYSCNGSLMADADWPMRTALYAAGTVMTGPVRIETGEESVPPDAIVYPWPLASPPTEYEVPYADGQSFGRSTRIAAPADAEVLRSLRDQALADAAQTPGYFYGIVFVQPPGYVVSIRDDLPFTDPADGLWKGGATVGAEGE